MDSHDRKAGASEPETPITKCRRPAQDNHPFLLKSRHAGRTALCPNVFSTGSGPNPRLNFPPEFLVVGTTIRCAWICQLFLTVAYWRSGGGHRKTRTLEPLIKSQGQRGLEPNIDKKAQAFSTVARFFFDNGRCMFCPGSGTKQAQSCVRCEREMK